MKGQSSDWPFLFQYDEVDIGDIQIEKAATANYVRAIVNGFAYEFK